MSDPTNNSSTQLTREIFSQMILAYQKLAALANKTIKEPNDEADITGYRTFLARAFLSHGPEFLNAWMIATEEYTPLVKSIACILQRSGAMIEDHNKRNSTPATAPGGEDAKIIGVLDGTKKSESAPADPAE